MTPVLRPATSDVAEQVAGVFRGWHDGHRGHVPHGLTLRRTPEAFRERVELRIAETRDTTVADVDGVVAGFIMVTGDEVEQVYVDRTFRAAGVADLLLAEAERQVAEAGHPSAWLAVVVGNARARAFYSRHGWRDEGDLAYDVVALGEHFTSPCRRYVKDVSRLIAARPVGRPASDRVTRVPQTCSRDATAEATRSMASSRGTPLSWRPSR